MVTGSTSGIGKAMALGLAAAGAEVVVNGRSSASVDAAIQAIASRVPGAKVRGVVADVGTSAGCAALIEAVPAADILISNAGIFEPEAFFGIPDKAPWYTITDGLPKFNGHATAAE
jgi:NAD(P)-dependent dehydrogenase (short-subunit alcohol dehydrogenase family)